MVELYLTLKVLRNVPTHVELFSLNPEENLLIFWFLKEIKKPLIV